MASDNRIPSPRASTVAALLSRDVARRFPLPAAFRAPVAISLAMLAVAGCSVHIHTQLLDRALRRPALCAEAVTVFHDSSSLSNRHRVVARLIPPPGGAEFRPPVEEVVQAQRRAAAALGANGLLVQDGVRHGRGLYDVALAVFIPDDSARAYAVCAAR